MWGFCSRTMNTEQSKGFFYNWAFEHLLDQLQNSITKIDVHGVHALVTSEVLNSWCDKEVLCRMAWVAELMDFCCESNIFIFFSHYNIMCSYYCNQCHCVISICYIIVFINLSNNNIDSNKSNCGSPQQRAAII